MSRISNKSLLNQGNCDREVRRKKNGRARSNQGLLLQLASNIILLNEKLIDGGKP